MYIIVNIYTLLKILIIAEVYGQTEKIHTYTCTCMYLNLFCVVFIKVSNVEGICCIDFPSGRNEGRLQLCVCVCVCVGRGGGEEDEGGVKNKDY